MKKTVIQIVLIAAVLGLVYLLYSQINTPMEFDKIRERREKVVVDRLKDIRTAQRSYRQKYSRFTPSFDTLINFVKYDSIILEKTIGSEDDSLAVAQGRVYKKTFAVAVKDTIFPAGFNIDEIRYIPFSEMVSAKLNDGKGEFSQFVMDTVSIETESKVVVPVFEAFAPYTTFLGDLDKQELINFRDTRVNTLGRDDGLKVGSLKATTNEAGNWE